MKRSAWVLMFLLGSAVPALAQGSLEARFSAANQAFYQGQYAAAREQYAAIVELGVEDADVFYNYGLAAARAEQLGLAVACFENAIRVGGRRGEFLVALNAVRGAIGARRAETSGEATVSGGESFLELIFGFVSRHAFGAALLLLTWVLLGMGIAMVLYLPRVTAADRSRKQLWLSLAAAVMTGLWVFSLLGVLTLRGTFLPGATAIALQDTELVEGPIENARKRGELSEGDRVFVTGVDGAFVRVRSDGAEGWARESDVLRLVEHH